MKSLREMSKTAKTGMVLSLFGVLGWAMAFLTVRIFGAIFGQETEIVAFRFFVVPSFLVASGLAVNYFEVSRILKIRPVHFTISLTLVHGIWAQWVAIQIPDAYNGFAMLFLFSFGLLYLKFSSGYLVTLIFSLVNMLSAFTMIYFLNIPIGIDEKLFFFFFGFSGLSSAIINETNRRNYVQMKVQERQIKTLNSLLEKDIETQKMKSDHVFQQISKVFYHHQIEQLANGMQLEQTMPIGGDNAYVLSFDIIASSRFRRADKKDIFREILAKCSEKAHEGYDTGTKASRAFSIKEMGDGFLCSIGFPFQSSSKLPAAESAVALAEEFIAIMERFNQSLDVDQQLYCSVGIAFGPVEGYFTTVPPIRYDLFGQGIVLATRYEQSRKLIYKQVELDLHVLILQEDVYRCLSAKQKSQFRTVNLRELGISIRDDESARFAYCRTVDAKTLPLAVG